MHETLNRAEGRAAARESRSLDGSSEDTTHLGETTGQRSVTSGCSIATGTIWKTRSQPFNVILAKGPYLGGGVSWL